MVEPDKFYDQFYIDNTNLTSKKDLPMVESTLIDYSIGSDKKWYLGTLIYLHPEKVVILPCCFDTRSSKYLHLENYNEINPTGVELSIHFLNRGHSGLVCEKDNRVQCSINGPYKVLLQQSTHKFMITTWFKSIEIKQSKKLYSIRNLPTYEVNKCDEKFKFLKLKKKQTLAKSQSLSKKNAHVVVATGPPELLLRNEHKGFAFPFMDRHGIKYPSIVRFYFLDSETSRTLIRKKQLSRSDYNDYIMNKATSRMDVNIFDIDKEGLVVEYNIDNRKTNISFKSEYYDVERKEHFQRDGIVMSHYVIQKALDTDYPKELINMIQTTYNNFAFKRAKTSDCIGINIYQGKK